MKTDEIQRAIGRLEGSMKSGFDAVNSRLDKINGTVVVHEEKINKNTGIINNFLGKISIVGSIGVFLGGLIVAALNYFLKK